MKGEGERILYVGKAKRIRNRVRQYFREGGDLRPQIPALIKQVASIETILVSSEKEALLLENTLIKRHQPPFNLLLKDDKGFIGIRLTLDDPWPKIELVRQSAPPKKGEALFGPYTSAYAARQTFDQLIRLFPLRRCSNRELASRTRPCLLYQIKRCVAPCVGYCTKEEYQKIVKRVLLFLEGRDQEVLKGLREQMKAASDALEFERAGALLQEIQLIESTIERQRVDQAGMGSCDVYGVYREGGAVSIAHLLFREGKLIGAEQKHFFSIAQEKEELLASFLLQHYEERPPPPEILIPLSIPEADLIADLLSSKEHPVKILQPQRGEKRALIAMAQKNAEAAFRQRKNPEHQAEERLSHLQEALQLTQYPRHIEAYDTAHLQGGETSAAKISYLDGNPNRERYRHYRLEGMGGDDYASLRQVLQRRLKRGKEEGELPDLFLIDGGRGHLNVALETLKEMDIVTIEVAALSKEKGSHAKGMAQEKIHLAGSSIPLQLPPHHPALLLLQEIRDEAHRFALKYHKKQRSKRLLHSSLEELPGIGPKKRQALLQTFQSMKRLLQATRGELEAIPQLNQKDVELLLQKIEEAKKS